MIIILIAKLVVERIFKRFDNYHLDVKINQLRLNPKCLNYSFLLLIITQKLFSISFFLINIKEIFG